jgi:glucan phosphoethanolaminetransferase (alkaline phosphatase superfamily)
MSGADIVIVIIRMNIYKFEKRKTKDGYKRNQNNLINWLRQKGVREIWQTAENSSKKRLNTDILNADSCLGQLFTLFSKDDKGLLKNEVQILDLVHADELGDGFTIQ